VVRSISVTIAVASLLAGLIADPVVRAAADATLTGQVCSEVAAAPFVDREQIAAVHLDRGSAPAAAVDGVARFGDVAADHTFHPEIEVLAAAGIIEGVTADRFEPSRPLRRDQATSLLVRSGAWLADQDLQATAGPYVTDVHARVHRSAIGVAFEHGLVEGLVRPCGAGEGRLAGGRPLERQQAATMLVRAFDALAAMERGEPGSERADADCPPPVWRPDLAAAAAYGAERQGEVTIAALGIDGSLVSSGSGTRVDAARVIKVMFLVACLRQSDVRDRALTQADRDLLEPMIRRSANDPARTITNRLGPGPTDRLAEQAGMQDFADTRPWGRSQSSARDPAAFLLEVDHQVVLLQHADGTRVAVMVTGSPSHDHGKATLQGVFERLLADLP